MQPHGAQKKSQCISAKWPSIAYAILNFNNLVLVSKVASFMFYLAIKQLEYGLMPNVMAALPNIGGALCSMPQSSADAHYSSAVQ